MSDLELTLAILHPVATIVVIVLYSINRWINTVCHNFAKKNLVNEMSHAEHSPNFAKDFYSLSLFKNRLSYCLGLLIGLAESLTFWTAFASIAYVGYETYLGVPTNSLKTMAFIVLYFYLITTVTVLGAKVLTYLLCGRTHNEVNLFRKGKLLCGIS